MGLHQGKPVLAGLTCDNSSRAEGRNAARIAQKEAVPGLAANV
jgi:hypothetical protein